MVFDQFNKIYSMLDKIQRRRAFWLLFLMVIGMIIETLGIGAVLPVMYLLSQPVLPENIPFLNSLMNILGNPSREVLVIWAMLSLGALFFVKGLFLSLLSFKQSSFTFDVKESLAGKLFKNYLHQPYTFYLNKNSAQLVTNITQELSYLTLNGILPLLQILSEFLVILAAITLLLVIEPKGALVAVLIVVTSTYFFNLIFKGKVIELGKKRQFHDRFLVKHLQQGFGGIKDIKITGSEKVFWDIFNEHNIHQASAVKLQSFIGQLPRIWIEVFVVLGVSSLVLLMTYLDGDLSSILPVLGIFGATAVRFIPSTNRIVGGVQSLKYGIPAINLVYNELKNCNVTQDSVGDGKLLSIKNEIRIKNVTFAYPNSSINVINNISFVLRKGETIGLIGPSGVGKSTLVDIILGLLSPKSGSIEVDGRDIQLDLASWRRSIGYVQQSFYLLDDSLKRNIALGVVDSEIDDQQVEKAISEAQLKSFVSSLPLGVDTVVGERGVKMSGGQRQRIAVARALYKNPEVLIFDEATSSLDNQTEDELVKAIDSLKGSKTILIIAHRLSSLKICSKVFELGKNGIIESATNY
ncbi:MAG: ATPase [Bdellovibrio sp. CG11_big_fil_rev_8_21_14_0_20_39_38]|nr:MAG: ATPase [Bdellovibrio sp. CG22_combo_CG10-13_8_21_14_all_39_27]PIR32547.1 MAG: ATPase [Bdellovibrio sp. CG11_big_fil_rev_8_21_14_0_20_39_38]